MMIYVRVCAHACVYNVHLLGGARICTSVRMVWGQLLSPFQVKVKVRYAPNVEVSCTKLGMDESR